MKKYWILLCLQPHIYKSIETTHDLHHTKILHLICYNQYDIVPHQTNSSIPLFHYTTMHINYPLNCKSSYSLYDFRSMHSLLATISLDMFRFFDLLQYNELYDRITSKPKMRLTQYELDSTTFILLQLHSC